MLMALVVGYVSSRVSCEIIRQVGGGIRDSLRDRRLHQKQERDVSPRAVALRALVAMGYARGQVRKLLGKPQMRELSARPVAEQVQAALALLAPT